MIGHKLIAPIAGAIVVMSVAALAGTAATSSATTAAAPTVGASGATGATASDIVSSRVAARNVLVDHRVTVSGVLQSTTGLEAVVLEERTSRHWHAVARDRDVAGAFKLDFRPRRLGLHQMRLRIAAAGGFAEVPVASLDVFHEVLASWYPPVGLTACGQELTAYTLGVANLSLPCGTRVTLRYHHRTLSVRVIDRGPYVAGRDYDLTWATKRALGAHDLTEVWANH